MRLKLSLTLLAGAALFLSQNPAQGLNEESVSRIGNGVTIKSLAPEKKASEKLESYPAIPKSALTTASPSAGAPGEADVEEFLNDPEVPETKSGVGMKPIIDKTKTKKPEAKTIESNASPFKKSQDAGAHETIKKPDRSPEVSSKSLMDDNISGDIKNLEIIKKIKDRATNAEDGVGESGLPIPRFVSLKSGEANARTGPGDSYPIRWTYQRKNLPLEVTAEFKLWRRIKDFDGEQSWVHQALLSSRRYCILKHDATGQSDYVDGHNVARFKRGVQVRLLSCNKESCKVEYGNIEGWLKKKDLWGVYAPEVFD